MLIQKQGKTRKTSTCSDIPSLCLNGKTLNAKLDWLQVGVHRTIRSLMGHLQVGRDSCTSCSHSRPADEFNQVCHFPSFLLSTVSVLCSESLVIRIGKISAKLTAGGMGSGAGAKRVYQSSADNSCGLCTFTPARCKSRIAAIVPQAKARMQVPSRNQQIHMRFLKK